MINPSSRNSVSLRGKNLGRSCREIQRHKSFSEGEIIGSAIRKNMTDQNFIFGDILAHLK